VCENTDSNLTESGCHISTVSMFHEARPWPHGTSVPLSSGANCDPSKRTPVLRSASWWFDCQMTSKFVPSSDQNCKKCVKQE
jgi:hypothetical protein